MRRLWFLRFLGIVVFLLAHVVPCRSDVCDEWDQLQKRIRDEVIEPQTAREMMSEFTRVITETYAQKIEESGFAFPVRGASPEDIGGRKGSGYVPNGFDLYDGNRHKGHPAHDIFIPDRNQDGLRDDTKKPVEVVAFTSGVVVGLNREWEKGSPIRGGKYVWIFNPNLKRYFYYAHLNEITVRLGDLVRAGEPIGILGRSGKNAVARRSPTHLHFMCLSFDGGRMTPYDPYPELLTARRD